MFSNLRKKRIKIVGWIIIVCIFIICILLITYHHQTRAYKYEDQMNEMKSMLPAAQQLFEEHREKFISISNCEIEDEYVFLDKHSSNREELELLFSDENLSEINTLFDNGVSSIGFGQGYTQFFLNQPPLNIHSISIIYSETVYDELDAESVYQKYISDHWYILIMLDPKFQ